MKLILKEAKEGRSLSLLPKCDVPLVEPNETIKDKIN